MVLVFHSKTMLFLAKNCSSCVACARYELELPIRFQYHHYGDSNLDDTIQSTYY